MPWDARSFHAHNHALSPAQSGHAASIANAVLRRSGDEGMAIATANKWAANHRANGGIVGYDMGGNIADPAQGGIGGVTPSAETMSPIMQGAIQRYATLPTEKLTELAARTAGTSQGQLIQRLLQQRRVQPQTAQPAPQMQQQGGLSLPNLQAGQQPQQYPQASGGATPHRAGGGGMSMDSPWWTRREASSADSGFLHGATAGRADAIETTAPGGSHVIPADVIAGLGEGNSLAGAKTMQSIIEAGPYGMPMPRGRAGRGPPSPPSAYHPAASGGPIPIFNPRRAGGVAGSGRRDTPVALSHGEFVVSPKDVVRWGHGDKELGHRVWDKFIEHRRKKDITTLKNLPGPVKG